MHTTLSLRRAVLVLFLFFLVFAALYFAKPFLIPLTFGVILSTLFYPFCRWMENKGVSRGFASFICVLTFVSLIGLIILLLVWQLSGMASEMTGIEEKLTKLAEKIQTYFEHLFGVTKEKQQQLIQKQQQSGSGKAGAVIAAIMKSLGSFLVDTILTLVYIFLLLFFRTHLRKAILKLVPVTEHETANAIIFKSSKVSQKYLAGLGMMIALLWVMYGIGFSIVGVKNAIFFAILCGLLEIVPFVGNLTGTALTILGSASQTGGGNLIIGILITYAIVQFIQTYLLEPLVVGSEQNINPLFTIIILVVGELVWGIPGMVLALPLLGIVKVICDHIPALQPYGFLIGKEKEEKGESIGAKIKKIFK